MFRKIATVIMPLPVLVAALLAWNGRPQPAVPAHEVRPLTVLELAMLIEQAQAEQAAADDSSASVEVAAR